MRRSLAPIGTCTRARGRRPFTAFGNNAWYDVSTDRQRFLMLKPDDASASNSIVVIQDWMEGISDQRVVADSG